MTGLNKRTSKKFGKEIQGKYFQITELLPLQSK